MQVDCIYVQVIKLFYSNFYVNKTVENYFKGGGVSSAVV